MTLSPFATIHFNSTTYSNYVGINAHYLTDKYAPKILNIFRSFPPEPSWRPGWKQVCGYLPWYCEFWTQFIVHTTGKYNDPERVKVFYSKFPAQSGYRSWAYLL